MRAKQDANGTKLWISARETYTWAYRLGETWPCSTLAGSRIFAAFAANGDLEDFAVDGRDSDCGADEFNALTSDFLRARYGPEHPAIRNP